MNQQFREEMWNIFLSDCKNLNRSDAANAKKRSDSSPKVSFGIYALKVVCVQSWVTQLPQKILTMWT